MSRKRSAKRGAIDRRHARWRDYIELVCMHEQAHADFISLPVVLRSSMAGLVMHCGAHGTTAFSRANATDFIEKLICCHGDLCLPPPPCKLPPLATPPPPPGDRHFHVFLVNMYCAGLCCPSALRMALQCFPITSNQAPVCVL